MKNLSYILMLATLLVSCSDSEEKVLAWVKIGDKWGYINPKGEIVIHLQFDWAGWFSEGLAWVNIGGKDGYINKAGEIVIKPQFDDAGSFSNVHKTLVIP